MSRLAAALLMTIHAAVTHAQGDPLASPECHAARAELAQALNAADNAQGPSGERLARARARAATACLGRNEGARERAGAPDPAQRVPPPLIVDGRATSLPKMESAPPPLSIPRPTFLTVCDASGC